MSKYKLCVLLGLILTATIANAIVPVSMRMRGLNPTLVGIVDDEYSDLFFNPAFISKIDGNRIYTNLSNVHNYGEDMFFSGDYAPYMYYNLIGGITTISDNRLGAIIEMGGSNFLFSAEEYTTENDNDETDVDSMTYESKSNNTDNGFNVFWGKQISGLELGAWIGPHMINSEESEKYTESNHFYGEDTTYYFEEGAMVSQAKTNAYPFMLGVIMGEPENEMSASFTFGFGHTGSDGPVNYLTSETYREISQTLYDYDEELENTEEKTEQGGFYIALNGRNKRRYEDYSYSFLAGLTFVNQPITMSYIDTTYDYYSPMSGYQEVEVSRTTQSAEGPMRHFSIALGIGTEKYFDMLNKKSMFAIGFLPSYFTGSTTMKVEPEQTHMYYFQNLEDTTEYTVDYSSNETMEIKNTFGGLQFTIPAGLETHLTDRLVLRLGATQNLLLRLKDSYEYTLTDEGWTQHYVSGPIDTTYAENPDELDSYYYKDEVKVSMSNSTEYYYGAGYKINDNIELNFLHFADLVNLKNWVLGINIKW